MKRALCRAGVVAALVAPLGACYPKEFDQGNPLGGLMVIFYLLGRTNQPLKAPGAKPTKVQTPITITGTVGGLDGTYDLALDDYGSFSGTASVKRQRFVTVVVNDTTELRDAVDAALTEQIGAAVTVTKAKARLKAFQTPGGVKVKFNGKITFQGTVDDGDDAGRSLKGSIKVKGQHPSAG